MQLKSSWRKDAEHAAEQLDRAKAEVRDQQAKLSVLEQERALGHDVRRRSLATCADILTPLLEVLQQGWVRIM